MSEGFWTITSNGEPVTLCGDCALVASNLAFQFSGIPPAQSMSEAANVLALIEALAGKTDAEPITYSETGECEDCPNDKEVSPNEWKERYMK